MSARCAVTIHLLASFCEKIYSCMNTITVKDFRERKGGQRLSVLTAYDASMARLLDSAGADALLVGDSLGMVVLGYDSTLPVTMEQMLHHAGAVSRGTTRALVLADMPFGSYQISVEQAVANGVRFIKEAGCGAVKLEGGAEVCEAVQALVQAGVPVMGHIGLTPQTAGQLGGYKVQGKNIAAARKLLADAKALAAAGVFSIVLEAVPAHLSEIITQSVAVPTIGIGAGPGCDGQVLVTNDLLGLFEKFTPKFVKQYANLAPVIQEAVRNFLSEVEKGTFPGPEHSFGGGEDFISNLLEES
ncbi:MAG: ketopantoate hydroxymethyltransferase [Candidatus Electronema aureum]|uniref:3-methyl-2-oxobutanoate hydroxymethyltransferase n=1 Tax=Candidatus Electronema aureum TaxID=2005002 RepID=A0A521G391_9BACT|nr:MAG: ketopantoate hydroxymethyltransferase [Candidatus Electronema aureum]